MVQTESILAVEDLDACLVTHIHLDHAGAAGHLAERGVPIHVHEFGAKHLIDPSKLLAATAEDPEREAIDHVCIPSAGAPEDVESEEEAVQSLTQRLRCMFTVLTVSINIAINVIAQLVR